MYCATSICTFADYIDPTVIEMFEQETDATIQYVNFTTNEEMYTKIEAGAASYDVLFPSDYMIERLIAEDMLAPLDTSAMPNLAGLIDWLKTPDYDPEGRYSVPYMWGTVGILYNTELVDGSVDSWDAIFEADPRSDIMMSSIRDTIACGLTKLLSVLAG